ncbi:MAG TPA: MFS transporter [Streptosporangiales bacterium]
MPGVRSVAASSLLARLPKGMVPLATVLVLHRATGSYAVAGSATALIAIGDAATTPVEGRLVDRFGMAAVLLPLAMLHLAGVAALLAFATRGSSVVGVAAGACAAGIGVPPVSGCVKAVWPHLVDRHRLPAAYAIESLLQQVTFLSGPLLVALCATLANPVLALASAAVLVGVGTAWFVIAARTVWPSSRERRHWPRGAMRVAAVRALVCTTGAQSMVFGALPVGIAAFTMAGNVPDLAGVVLASQTLGGVLGTFLPARTATARRYTRLLVRYAAALGPVAVMAASPSSPTLFAIGLALLVAGLSITPIAATGYLLTEQATQSTHRTEAFAWLSTGQAVGNAAGAAVAGMLIEHAGTVAALTILPLAAALAAAISHWALRPTRDDTAR